MATPLPIDSLLPDIVDFLRTQLTCIIQATPGAGKTTRVPPALLSLSSQTILVLEPRRLAARLSAQRIAHERNEECGKTVGYVTRYDKQESAQTRLKFITEGLFLRFFIADKELSGVGCVVIDEFHERHVHTDIALMLVRLLQQTTRPDLRLVIMSATLDTQNLAPYLPQARAFVCKTPQHPVTVEYIPQDMVQRPLESKVLWALQKAQTQSEGHILVFLPGRSDIERCYRLLAAENPPFSVHMLSASSSYDDQQRVFETSTRRKVILSTNVAETSITIDGVCVVIDSGLAHIAGHAAWSGMPTLTCRPISQAACQQRAGRAGRTAPGHTIRLFSSYDYHKRPAFDTPEIQRTDLSQALLELKALGVENPPWFDPPPQSALTACERLLQDLGAYDANLGLTQLGAAMSLYPLHPRHARLVEEGRRQQCVPQALLVACLLNEGPLFHTGSPTQASAHTGKQTGSGASDKLPLSHSDISTQLGVLADIIVHKKQAPSYVNKTQLTAIQTLFKKLCAAYQISWMEAFRPLDEQRLSVLILASYADRIYQAQHRDKTHTGVWYKCCLGGEALLSPRSSVTDETWIVALGVEETSRGTQAPVPYIHVCHGFEVSLLWLHKSAELTEKEAVVWDSEKKSALFVKQIFYRNLLVKQEQVSTQHPLLEATLHEELKREWPQPFEDSAAVESLNVRLALATQYGYDLGITPLVGEEFDLFLCFICEGKRSFSQIQKLPLTHYLNQFMGESQMRQLNTLLPTTFSLKNRQVPISYQAGQEPFIASRLQDFFGMSKTPRILNGKIPLVIHFLAPNKQSVQVSSDIEGFWKRSYPTIRRELARRYPRHSWPEDPTAPAG